MAGARTETESAILNGSKVIVTSRGVGNITVESVVGVGASEANIEIRGATTIFGFKFDGGKNTRTIEGAREGSAGEAKNTVGAVDNITEVVAINSAGLDLDNLGLKGVVVDNDVGGIGGAAASVEDNIDSAGAALFESARTRIYFKSRGKSR